MDTLVYVVAEEPLELNGVYSSCLYFDELFAEFYDFTEDKEHATQLLEEVKQESDVFLEDYKPEYKVFRVKVSIEEA